MKTKEELNALKNEVETLKKNLAELTEEELAQVVGGSMPPIRPDEKYVMSAFTVPENDRQYDIHIYK